jgi:integrase
VKRSRYQNGCLRSEPRKEAPDAWVFYWREQGRLKKKVIGSKREFRTESEALKHIASLKFRINEHQETPAILSLGMVIQHYIANELECEKPRLDYSTRCLYAVNFKNWIVPRWEDSQINKVKGIEVEKWLAGLTKADGVPLADGTKAKLRNMLSAVYSHAIRYGWISNNPIATVRQSAKRQTIPDILTVEELGRMLEAMSVREYTLVVLDFGTGLRVSEMLALKWSDIVFDDSQINVQRKIYHGHIGDCKSEASKKPVAMDRFLAETLMQWRGQTAYAAPDDWVFASPIMGGKQPYWPDRLRDLVQETAKQLGIKKQIGWHTFRRTLSSLLIKNGNDIKTVQEMLRHATTRILLEVYAQAMDASKLKAQGQVYKMLLDTGTKPLLLPSVTSPGISVTAKSLKDMVGTRRLELLTSTVSR